MIFFYYNGVPGTHSLPIGHSVNLLSGKIVSKLCDPSNMFKNKILSLAITKCDTSSILFGNLTSQWPICWVIFIEPQA